MVTNERMNVVSQKKQRYRATIAGKTYTILGTKSHQHMHSVIKLLKTRTINDVRRRKSTIEEKCSTS